MKDTLLQFILGVIYVAILFVLVKPNSDAAKAIKTLGDALQKMVVTATASQKNPNAGGTNA